MHIVDGQLPVQFGRKFHLSSYEGSHAQVLFRSGRTGYHRGEYLEYGSIVDVLFKNVAALAIMESYYPLKISMGDEVNLKEFQRIFTCEIGDRNLYILHGADSVGYMLAGALYWVDDKFGSTDQVSMLIANSARSDNVEVKRA
jgi:hypothetical protein